MNRGRRLALGIFVLLLVDIIWVVSSELSEYIFNDIGYDKPFFSTYLKTSMFTLYLVGFIFWRPWRRQCSCSTHTHHIYQEVDINEDEDEDLQSADNQHLRTEGSDSKVAPIFTVNQLASTIARDNDESAKLTHLVMWRYLPVEQPKFDAGLSDEKSEASYVPLKLQESHEKSSEGESDDSSIKSVRFSKLTEVRQMSENEGLDAMMSRLSFSASLRAEQLALLEANKLTIKEVMQISLIFCLLWFAGNYAYQLALSDTKAGIVNIISSASGLFTLILAGIFPSSFTDKFTVSKLLAVLLMIVGVVLVSLEDISMEESAFPVGVMWALIGSVLYACYMVFLKRKVPTEDRMDFTMFFGFVGLFNVLILWPGFPLLDVLGWETFQLPNLHQFLMMSVNGLVGTVLSELLWLWGCFLTSSLMGTLSLSLTIPLTVLVDIWVKDIQYSFRIYAGALPMMVSFVAVIFLTHFENWDPLMDGLKLMHKKCCKQEHLYSLVDTEGVERESLIVNDIEVVGGEEEDEDEVDTTLVTDPVTGAYSPTLLASESSISSDSVLSPSANNLFTNHV